jgi:hypothetical protein
LYFKSVGLAAFWFLWAAPALAQVAILQIRVIEGEGAVHPPGSHSTRPITVEITEETGRPVAGAAVSFHLPEDGPGGAFVNGLRTEVVITDANGHASLHGLLANRIPGRFQVRIVASKEQARAGTVSFQYVAEIRGGTAAPRRSEGAPEVGCGGGRAGRRGRCGYCGLARRRGESGGGAAECAGRGGVEHRNAWDYGG